MVRCLISPTHRLRSSQFGRDTSDPQAVAAREKLQAVLDAHPAAMTDPTTGKELAKEATVCTITSGQDEGGSIAVTFNRPQAAIGN